MSYTTSDFEECLGCTGRGGVPKVDKADIKRVIGAWGSGDGRGTDAGHLRHVDDEFGVTEWAGGFLCQLKDGRFAYISGWNDYTGWG